MPTALFDVAGKIGYGDLGRCEVVHHFDEAHRALRESEDVSQLREGDGAKKGLDVEPIRYFDQVDEVVREPEGRDRVGRDEDREAPSLVPPELGVVIELGESLVDGHEVCSIGAGGLELAPRFGREVLQLDALGVAARGRIRGEIEGDRSRMPALEEAVDLGARGEIGVKVHWKILAVVGVESYVAGRLRGLGEKQVEAKAAREITSHELPLDAVPRLVERRGERAEATLPRSNGHDPAADAALARQADVVEPVARRLVETCSGHHRERVAAGGGSR